MFLCFNANRHNRDQRVQIGAVAQEDKGFNSFPIVFDIIVPMLKLFFASWSKLQFKEVRVELVVGGWSMLFPPELQFQSKYSLQFILLMGGTDRSDYGCPTESSSCILTYAQKCCRSLISQLPLKFQIRTNQPSLMLTFCGQNPDFHQVIIIQKNTCVSDLFITWLAQLS